MQQPNKKLETPTREDAADVNAPKNLERNSEKKEAHKKAGLFATVLLGIAMRLANALPASAEGREGSHRNLVLKESPQVRMQLQRQGGVKTNLTQEGGRITKIKIGPFQERGADGNIVLDETGKPKLQDLEETDALKNKDNNESAEVTVEATGDGTGAIIKENITETPKPSSAGISIGGRIRHIKVTISLKNHTATIEKMEATPDTNIK